MGSHSCWISKYFTNWFTALGFLADSRRYQKTPACNTAALSRKRLLIVSSLSFCLSDIENLQSPHSAHRRR